MIYPGYNQYAKALEQLGSFLTAGIPKNSEVKTPELTGPEAFLFDPVGTTVNFLGDRIPDINEALKTKPIDTSNRSRYRSGIVTGLDSNGQVDRTQSDEYKSIRAQYDTARKELSEEEALAKGLELFAQANPELVKTPTPNPLMENFYPLPGPAASDSDLGMNSGDPLVQQEQQQAMTAGQANAATTAGTKSITNQVEEFLARRTGRA